MIFFLQIRNLKHRKGMWLAKSHTANKWRYRYSHSYLSEALRSLVLSPLPYCFSGYKGDPPKGLKAHSSAGVLRESTGGTAWPDPKSLKECPLLPSPYFLTWLHLSSWHISLPAIMISTFLFIVCLSHQTVGSLKTGTLAGSLSMVCGTRSVFSTCGQAESEPAGSAGLLWWPLF